MTSSRLVGHICRQAFGRSQTRPLADQQNNDGWLKSFADVVQSSHPSVTDQEWLAELPARASQPAP